MNKNRHSFVLFICLQAALLLSCAKKQDCPGFSNDLVPYIPQENRLLFRNTQGDSLSFTVSSYNKSEPYVSKQNIFKYETKAPGCSAQCSMNGTLDGGQNQNFNCYMIGNELSDSCSFDITLLNDYFHQTVRYSSYRPFGDTLWMQLYNGLNSYTRFDHIEIVYGRGITKLHDVTKNCEWYR